MPNGSSGRGTERQALLGSHRLGRRLYRLGGGERLIRGRIVLRDRNALKDAGSTEGHDQSDHKHGRREKEMTHPTPPRPPRPPDPPHSAPILNRNTPISAIP